MNKIFAVGDVHGQYTMFKELLDYWDEEKEQLVLLGDLGDRGEDPKACFELARHLVEEKGAICLMGNHEVMLANFLEQPNQAAASYEMNGGMVTVQSLLNRQEGSYDAAELAEEIKSQYPWLLPFLKSRPLTFEWESYVFVHAGVDLTLDDWKDTTDYSYVWIREGFYDQPNHTGKMIVFGHTITPMLHGKQVNTDIWQSGDGLIGIDGGAVYGGTLHGVVFDREGIQEQYKVDSGGNLLSRLFGRGRK